MNAPTERPEVGDILIVVHNFEARSSDELTLTKGDRVELVERDDEFGDGWYLGKHIITHNTGLFPAVYTQLAPKTAVEPTIARAYSPIPPTSQAPPPVQPSTPSFSLPLSPPSSTSTNQASTNKIIGQNINHTAPAYNITPSGAPNQQQHQPQHPIGKVNAPHNTAPPTSAYPASPKDAQLLNDTLNVIDEHITNLRAPRSTNLPNATDSGSDYSNQFDHRISYIQGEETDEEGDSLHTRNEVELWSPDDVAEYLFTVGVEKSHCEIFRDQEISGEVLLTMDQNTIFLKAFDLGSVGRRLKTWQRIKALQDEVDGIIPSTNAPTPIPGTEPRSATRSRNNTLTGSQKAPSIMSQEGGRVSAMSMKNSAGKRVAPFANTSVAESPPASSSASQMSPHPNSPSSAIPMVDRGRRPSAASIRDLNHSRRHSSAEFKTMNYQNAKNSTADSLNPSKDLPPSPTSTYTTRLPATPGQPPKKAGKEHKKQPSFDRNWTLGGAYAQSRPLSTNLDDIEDTEHHLQPSNEAAERGYFSGTESDKPRQGLLKKLTNSIHSHRVSRIGHQHYDSIDSVSRQEVSTPTSTHKFFGFSFPHRRNTSTNTTNSSTVKQPPSISASGALVTPPTVTKLDGQNNTAAKSPMTSPPSTSSSRSHSEWLSSVVGKSSVGQRATSEMLSNSNNSNASGANKKATALASPVSTDSQTSSPQSPTRTSISTPSNGASVDTDVGEGSRTSSTSILNPARRKGKQETSAYQRGLQQIGPAEARLDADYYGWMKKKSSNLMTTWKPRFFVLKGRRLAYYYSEDDDQEKGLIDISFHRVLSADNERLTGLHATLTGAGSTPVPKTSPTTASPSITSPAASSSAGDEDEGMFIFKLVPPRAGLSRAVNFTKPMVHYFAVPSVQQGRLWMAALVRATIERDDSIPISMTYQHKTISLTKAQSRHGSGNVADGNEADESDGGEAKSGDGTSSHSGVSAQNNAIPPNPMNSGKALAAPSSITDSHLSSSFSLGLSLQEDYSNKGNEAYGLYTPFSS